MFGEQNSSNRYLVLAIICVILFVLVVPFEEPTTTVVKPANEEIVYAETQPTEALLQETQPMEENKPFALELHQIDVGCANAYLIRYNGKSIFIDGGQSYSQKKVINFLNELGVQYLDIVFVTHWHGDHADNTNALLEKYGNSTTIVFGPSKSINSKYPISKGSYIQLKNGQSFDFDGVTLTCVGPYEVKNSGESNYDSLNFVIQYRDFKAMFTGDYVYDQVIEEHPEITKDIDVLQMPHHGLEPLHVNEYSLRHFNPKLVLVPANSSSHTNRVMRELNPDTKVLNNQSGCIAVVTYGNKDDYEIYTGVIASDFIY